MQNIHTGLAVLQFNCHRSAIVNNEADRWMNQQDRCIALLQEPGYEKGKIRNFNSKNSIIVGDESSARNRACIVTSPNLKVFKLNQFCNRDQTTVTLSSNVSHETIVFSSVYMPYDPAKSPPEQITKDLVHHCERKGLNLIIGTDCNSHNEVWGSTDSNPRGEDLLEFIFSTSLQICNIGTESTFIDVRKR